MEINRMTTAKKTFEPLQQPSNFNKKEVTIEQKQNTISFAIDHHIVTKGNQIGILLANMQDAEAAIHIISKELKFALQLVQQLPMLLEEKNEQNEKIYQELLKNVQELVKNVHIRHIPLLDGTYDFLELPAPLQQYGKQMMIPLLDLTTITNMLEHDPSKIEMVLQIITSYMKNFSNSATLADVAFSKERDISMWRALAEMNMTQLSQQIKQLTKEHKWSITIFFLFIWLGCLYVIGK